MPPSADVLLVHRRLAIIDPGPDGAQPMATPDGRHHIVFNGEVYNYRELRCELESRGERFSTASDTEVLLRLIVRDGPAALARVRGMFAFACWDTHDRALFMARDRFGIKPLEAYDCTELTSIAATNVRDKTLQRFTQVGMKSGTVGQPLPGVAGRIVNQDTWEPLPVEQEGVLLVSGPNVMQGYLNDQPRTDTVLRDGWYNTGDRAVMDEDGFITITTPDPPN
jgi:acyl-CoA synthetase (AMP-forming)/AMP-acid ligase II